MSKSKKFLSMLLACAMLITCISGLTLVSSAADTDLTGTADVTNGGELVQNGVFLSQGWCSLGFDLHVPAKAYDQVKAEISYNATNRTGWQIAATYDKDGNLIDKDEQGGTYDQTGREGWQPQENNTWLKDYVANQWCTGVVSFKDMMVNHGVEMWGNSTGCDVYWRFQEGGVSIRFIKFTLVDGETTYVRTWGTDPDDQSAMLEQAKATLKADIDKAEGIDESLYTDESVAAMKTALAAAKVVSANGNATLEELNAAHDSLSAAINGLLLVSKVGISGAVVLAWDVCSAHTPTMSIENNYNYGNIQPSNYISYVVDIATTGKYDIALNLAKGNDGTANVAVQFDGEDKGSVAVPQGEATGGNDAWHSFYDYTINDVELAAGRHTLTIVFTDGSVNYHAMALTYQFAADAVSKVELPAPSVVGPTAEITTFEGKTAVKFSQASGLNYANGALAEAMGIPAGEAFDMSVSMDYYRTAGGWLRIRAFNLNSIGNEPGGGFNAGAADGFAPDNDLGMQTTGAWATMAPTAKLANFEGAMFGAEGTNYDFQFCDEGGLGADVNVYISRIQITAYTKDGKKIVGTWDPNAVAADVHSVTLDGSLNLNFFFKADIDATAAEATIAGKAAAATYEKQADGTYKVSVKMAAKEMTDDITVVLVDAEGNKSDAHTYSVAQYAADALAEGTDADALIKAMLNYGAAAQVQFNHNTDKLANADLADADKDLSAVTAESLKTFANLTSEGGLKAASLVLESETVLRMYFENGDVKDTVIFAQNLAKDVTENGATYNPMTYCYNVLNSEKTSDALKNVVRALVLYNQAAVEFVG